MNLRRIREIVIMSMGADSVLEELLVLKGGNALEIVHGIGARSSLDVDYSIAGDIPNPVDVGKRLERALSDRFDSESFVLFDFSFGPRPEASTGTHQGGYRAEFKIIARDVYDKHKLSIESLRRNAHAVADDQKRIFKIDISKYEYVAPKEQATLDEYTFYVYSPLMIAFEKLRAICQQMDYPGARAHPTPRPRDFYDICAVVREKHLDLVEHGEMLGPVFGAKSVPLGLLGKVRDTEDFHRASWDEVKNAVAAGKKLESFEFYFQFVLKEIERLETFWKVYAPAVIE